jgi:hypothetical protein
VAADAEQLTERQLLGARAAAEKLRAEFTAQAAEEARAVRAKAEKDAQNYVERR